MLPDFHVHTEFSGDSQTPVTAQIERAIELGMETICITDHHDIDAPEGDCCFLLDIPAQQKRLAELKKIYADRIEILTGIELGLQSHVKDAIDEVLNTYEFDFVLGSCHYARGMDPYQPAYFDQLGHDEGYRVFFEATLQRVKQFDDFDSLSHLDYLVRYEKTQHYDYALVRDLIDEILQVLIMKNKALEVNSGGFKYGLNQPNPRLEILKRYRELGGHRITLGSDAHKPEQLGISFEETKRLLKSCGYDTLTIFKKRTPIELPL